MQTEHFEQRDYREVAPEGDEKDQHPLERRLGDLAPRHDPVHRERQTIEEQNLSF